MKNKTKQQNAIFLQTKCHIGVTTYLWLGRNLLFINYVTMSIFKIDIDIPHIELSCGIP